MFCLVNRSIGTSTELLKQLVVVQPIGEAFWLLHELGLIPYYTPSKSYIIGIRSCRPETLHSTMNL
jgi:hypothetical protein